MSLKALIALWMFAIAPGAANGEAQENCPPVRPGDVARVREFFTSPHTAEFRERHDLVGVRAENVRALEGEGDAELCRRLSREFRIEQNEPYPKVWSAFQAGDYYVVKVRVDIPPGVLYYGNGGMMIFDREMRYLVAVR